MAFLKRTWLARLGTGLNKFLIGDKGADGKQTLTNSPDAVVQEGDVISADNLNDLEDRIKDEFDDNEAQIQTALESITAMKLTKIWENSTPNQSFASQIIQIQDLSSYEAIIIEWVRILNGTGISSSFAKLERNGAVSSGRVGILLYFSAMNITSSFGAVRTYDRGVTWDPSLPNQLSCADCSTFEVRTDGTITATAATNNSCIPYRIYGIKELLN